MRPEWNGFVGGKWEDEINVRDFIQKNYTPYDGDESFLAGPTQNTKDLWAMVMDLTKKEREAGGVLDMDTKVVSTIVSHGPGYLDKSKETIVGFQTDKPFKRSMQPYGGIRMAEKACADNGYTVDPEISEFFSTHRKTHNAGCFDAYTPEMRACRSSHVITGLPDAYGRGRIIGDYRRVALYGIDRLIEDKEAQKESTGFVMTDDVIRLREELSEQLIALKQMKEMAASYGCDISKPATNVQEAIQATYFGYLSAVKEQNGAAMSLGRTSTFIDCYAERDLKNGTFTEEQIQEFIDHFIMKLRCVKFARTPEYNQIFAGDPVWVTESIGGVGIDGRHMVTKMSFRYLHTLENLGAAPEPNLTVLWSTRLPEAFKKYCAKISIQTSSVQYENDDLMRVTHGDDYGIACCVSSMVIGKQMQFFGARANLAKCLLYALNGGVDEVTKKQVGPKYRPVTGDVLDYDDVMDKYTDMMEWLAGVYVNTLNIIHYMHDKYCYERAQMALHDRDVYRYFATGFAGLSVVTDSLCAIKYATVKPIRDEDGIIVDFETTGDFPKYGNDDDRADKIAHDLVETFMKMLRRHHTYRDSFPTMSVLTITSNVTYGKATGNTPDGRKKGQPFAPGANPMHGRDTHGAVASLSSVSKLPFEYSQDGISNTFTIIPDALGKDMKVVSGDIELDLNK
ncbi:formate C-acetyltransferase [Lacrimispora saccharolytica]|uniref:formate C-acetyltransferase n=1 Tax=Lacrimispora saccharolytica TaxID=84030 RepID=UPI001B44F718|nr:formate C-acetyltransferase [Lacrimispora saccharolytica]MBP9001563.1 formate C-acetyltransferase [Lachnospiraceae bacterium]MCF2656411.1 formate C-acetyltransferase [Lacrimispora saccharolytica]MCI7557629.1 formate C-acetyltransferase [Lachnospiraceae bacterium]MDY4127078.1 formate C-acetyltransferase [Lachnospiraceae bacterium]